MEQMSEEEYWRKKASDVVEEHHLLLQSQRDELERLQRWCSELMYERSMIKAAAAEDVRQFCVEYQQKVLQQQQQTPAPAGRPSTAPSPDAIPIQVLMQFLHRYSAGLVPLVECNKRKRSRETTGSGQAPNTLHQQRLVQRVMARQRLRLREDDVQELQPQKQQQCADGAR